MNDDMKNTTAAIVVVSFAVAVAGAAAKVYKVLKKKNNDNEKTDSPGVSLGEFVFWGRPNVGKTTLIKQLLGEKFDANEKKQTSSKENYENVTLRNLDGGPFVIDRVFDMPGTEDRLRYWVQVVKTEAKVFYIVDLERIVNKDYISRVKWDVKETIKALGDSNKNDKRINIIATHLDVSNWKDYGSDVGNVLQEDDDIRGLLELMGDVAGYIYAVNLLDKTSVQKLLQSIVNDR